MYIGVVNDQSVLIILKFKMSLPYSFRKAIPNDIPAIWAILKDAIQRRKEEGSNQWQDGYPNVEIVSQDIEKGTGFVLVEGAIVVGYTAVLINDEPAYNEIKGTWLTTGDFVVYHRVAIAQTHLGKGLAKQLLQHIENFARENSIQSVKVDTNFDNHAMLRLFDSFGYVYCGEVFFRGSARRAYEKVLS